MLGFTLSKLNLLIFVIAVFAIVSYFLIGFQNVAQSNAANNLVKLLANDSFAIYNSASYCDAKAFYLPSALANSSSGSIGGGFYILNVSYVAKKDSEGNDLNVLIFAVSPRRTLSEEKEFVAAASFDANAVIILFQFGTGGAIERADNFTEFDPQAFPGNSNAFVLIKEVIGDQKTFYFIPCSTLIETSCQSNEQVAGQMIKGQDSGFNCGISLVKKPSASGES